MTEAHAKATLEPVSDVARIAEQWASLEPQCEAPVFQSSTWLMPWLEAAVGRFDVQLVRAEKAGVAVGLGLLVMRRMKRRLFSVETLFVNETGPSELDFCIEHNGFLLHRDHQEEALLAILRCLRGTLSGWDELHLRRAAWQSAVHKLSPKQLSPMGLRLRQVDHTVAPLVDLETVRASGQDFMRGLTSNRRTQIRRAMKLIEQHGPIQVDAAQSVVEAMQFFDELKNYHQRYWEARGEPGVFANPQWETFHRSLIAKQLASGGVQLLRVMAGNTSVGYIYSLVHSGRVYMIQSGFNYDLDPKAHPGECCHVAAIEWNLKAGNAAYDFLAGDMRYKRSLSNRVIPMAGVVLQRKRWRFMLEDALRLVYRRLHRTDDDPGA